MYSLLENCHLKVAIKCMVLCFTKLMIQVTNGSKDHIDSVNKVTIMLSHQN